MSRLILIFLLLVNIQFSHGQITDSLFHVWQDISDPGKFNMRYLGRIQVKGKTDSMGAYECIDGDHPELLDGKLKTLKLFNDALENFLNGEFAEATGLFNRIIRLNPGDQAAKYFRQKSAHYTVNGVPDDWDGVEKLLEK